MEWITTLPEKDGTFVVKTKTMFREQVMYATVHTNEKGKRFWSFSNQDFVAYLKE